MTKKVNFVDALLKLIFPDRMVIAHTEKFENEISFGRGESLDIDLETCLVPNSVEEQEIFLDQLNFVGDFGFDNDRVFYCQPAPSANDLLLEATKLDKVIRLKKLA